MPPNNSGKRRAAVLIVDDHPAVREALAIRISQARGLEVCGEADDVQHALKLAAEKKPAGAIVDIALKKETASI